MVSHMQLFSRAVDDDLIMRVLGCFGIHVTDLKYLRTGTYFNIDSMNTANTQEQMQKLSPALLDLYIPCKRNHHVKPLSCNQAGHRSCITVLKQLLRTRNIRVYSRVKQRCGVVQYNYYLAVPHDSFHRGRKSSRGDDTLRVIDHEVTVSFE